MPRDLREITQKLKSFYLSHARMPSYGELAVLFNYRSKNAAYKLARCLHTQGLIAKDATGKLIPRFFDTPLARATPSVPLPLLGTVRAGFGVPVEDEPEDTMSLDDFLIERPDASFMVKVQSDSMIDAGIRPGDMIIVERGCTPKKGDIVVARADSSWSLRYFTSAGGELIVEGVVKGVVRKY